MTGDDEVAAVIVAAVALLAARTTPAPPAPARWRLAGRLGDAATRSAPANVRSRWSAAGRTP
jgi:hypothetical protein